MSITPTPDFLASLRQDHGTDDGEPRSTRESRKYWSSIKINEDVRDELKALVREDLKKSWYSFRDYQHRFSTKINWSSADSERVVLKDKKTKLRPRDIQYFCNKPTSIYWLPSAQKNDGLRTLILAAMYEEWARSNKNNQNIEFGHFLANPIRITSTGPSTINEIIDAHLDLCTQARRLTCDDGGVADKWLSSRWTYCSSDTRHYYFHQLHPAIVMIMDQIDWPDNSECRLEPDGFFNLRMVAQHQTVLIARTGSEEGLAASISFETLRSQAMPLEMAEASVKNVDIVRVPLASAVQFIVNLERREDTARPPPTLEKTFQDSAICLDLPKGFGAQARFDPDAWADAHIAMAEAHGFDHNWDTYWSIRRVLAGLLGESYADISEPWLFGNWKVKSV
ncbi:MAG: hypothetical protein Q9227_004824 [Pyrenula ochraceoflavens]